MPKILNFGADVFSEMVGSWSSKFWVCEHGLNSNFARWDPEDGKACEGPPEKGVKKAAFEGGPSWRTTELGLYSFVACFVSAIPLFNPPLHMAKSPTPGG